MKYRKRRLVNELLIVLRKIFTPKNIFVVGAILLVVIVIIPVIAISSLRSSYDARLTSDTDDLSPARVALVLAAPIDHPSQDEMLANRVQAAVELYQQDRVDTLIISAASESELDRLQGIAVKSGVEEADIELDSISTRTYDSCYLTKHKYNISSAVVVSQELHLNRAVYICNSVGVKSQGYIAEDVGDVEKESWLNETLAFIKAVWEVNVAPPCDITVGDVIEL